MIPVVTTDKNGNLYNQVFNDSLTIVEQINRITLEMIAKTQTKLTNGLHEFQAKVGSAEYTDEQLEAIKTAVTKMSAEVDKLLSDYKMQIAKFAASAAEASDSV